MTRAVIIGSGAGAAPLAWTLSKAGLKVLVLEKGPRYERADYVRDEVAMSYRNFFTPSLDEDPHIVVADDDPPHRTDLGWIACCVGGGTVHMGGYLYRLHPEDFRLGTKFPGHRDLVDWPFTYEELEPYYTRAEQAVGVAGAAEAHPFEGPRSAPYPLPPLERHPLAPHLEHVLRDAGMHPFPTPRSINSRPYRGRPSCAYCESCAGYGCRVGAKGSVQETLLAQAERTGRCTILPRSMVKEILTDGRNRATGCVYLDAVGREHETPADVVCLCASAIESARLLLLSKSSRFPDGLANSNGWVGRGLTFHATSSGRGRFRRDRHPDLPLDVRHPFLDVSSMDHYFLPEGVAELPKGGLIRFGVPQPAPVSTALGLSWDEEKSKSIWGKELQRRLRDSFVDYCTVDFEVFHDSLAHEDTFVELDPDVQDTWGLPVARIHLNPTEHQRVAGRWLVKQGLEALERLGADELDSTGEGQSAKYLVEGTCRAGEDPRTSVLDRFCRTHEVPNLYVVDGSFFPTSGGAPPTLTILANAFRVGEHLVARDRDGAFDSI